MLAEGGRHPNGLARSSQPAAGRYNQIVSRRLRIGERAEIAVMDRDPRCKMITLDPDTAEANPEVMRRVARDHGGTAGIYAAVVIEGAISAGDPVALVG